MGVCTFPEDLLSTSHIIEQVIAREVPALARR